MAEKQAMSAALDLRLLRRVWAFVRPNWKMLIVGLILIPLSTAFELAQPYLLKLIIDEHIAVRSLAGMDRLVIIYVVLVSCQSLTQYGQLYAIQLLGQQTIHGLRKATYEHVLRQTRAFFDHRPVGQLLTRLTNDVETINEIFTNGVITLLADLVKMVAIVATMFVLDAKLTLFLFLTFPPLFLVVSYARRIMRNSFREIRAKLAGMNAFVQEHVSGIKVIQLFLRERRAQSKYDELNASHRDAYLGAIRADATMYAAVEAIGVCAAAGVAWYAGANIAKTGLSVGLVVAFIEYINKFFIPVRDFSAKYTVMQSAMAATERIADLLDTEEPDAPLRGERGTKSAESAVQFDKVRFAYSTGDEVLRGVSLQVPSRKTVAVVGATGSGKSTLIRLLTRLYEPTSGSITLDGELLSAIPADEVRSRLTVVSQDAFLFSGSVADNVRMGRATASDDEVRAALERVGAMRLLAARDRDIDESVQERGGNFSSGERQLIAFARALIRDSEFLILDEATAHVDPEIEEIVESGLKALMHGRTSLIIAHRLSTIRRADHIVVLSKGLVAEQGTHQELVELGGLYAELERSFRTA